MPGSGKAIKEEEVGTPKTPFDSNRKCSFAVTFVNNPLG